MKKIIGFLAIIVMAVAVFAATKNVNQSENVDLASLTSLNTANAECVPTGIIWGQCLVLSDVCVLVTPNDYMDCDPYQN